MPSSLLKVPARRAAAVLIGVAAALTSTAPLFALDLNGFLQEKGHGDVAVSYTAESYDRFWVGGTKVPVPNSGSVNTGSATIWAAYGVTDRLTLVANLPYINANSPDGFYLQERAWQDLTVLGEYGLYSAGSTIHSSVVGAFGMRTIASNYEANSPVDVGDGTADWLFRLVYQIRWRDLYASQQVGLDLRSGDAPDGHPLFTEIGWTVRRLTLSGLYARLTARGGTNIGDPGFTFPSNGDEYTRIGAKVYGRIASGLGASAMYFTTLNGRNAGEAGGVSVGLVYSY